MPRVLSAVALAFLLAACKSGEMQTAGTAPGALAKPIDQYSGQELRALTQRLVFTGGVERDRRCKGAPGCDTAAGTTRLRVDAVQGEDSLSAGALPPNGAIAARVLNRGSFADAMYSTTPGANREFYLVVLPGAKAGAATWRLEQLDLSGSQPSHSVVGTGIFRECHHPFARGARADFKTCEQAALIHDAAFVLPQTTDSPIWIGCATGCCTADPGTT